LGTSPAALIVFEANPGDIGPKLICFRLRESVEENMSIRCGFPLSRIVKFSLVKPVTGPFLSRTTTLICTSRVVT
jgi:hypothetical protein